MVKVNFIIGCCCYYYCFPNQFHWLQPFGNLEARLGKLIYNRPIFKLNIQTMNKWDGIDTVLSGIQWHRRQILKYQFN